MLDNAHSATEMLIIRMYVEQDKSYRDIADELDIDYFRVSDVLKNFTTKDTK